MYHFGDWYYLMVAEGGTEYGHMVTYARSKDPYGPFEAYAENPVLTNRNLGGNENHIQGIGHGDLITTPYGETFMVCLGFRIQSDWMPFHHLGRLVFKISLLDLLGTITGGMTSTPGLAAADSMVDSNIPSVAYATVYPIAMVFLILFIQIIASAVY